MSDKRELTQNAEALEDTAAVADYLSGLAAESDPAHSEKIKSEAEVLRAWAAFCRTAAASA